MSLNSYRNATKEANLRAKLVPREGPQGAILCNMLNGPKLPAAPTMLKLSWKKEGCAYLNCIGCLMLDNKSRQMSR